MKPTVIVPVPRPTRMAGVLAWLVGLALFAAGRLGTAYVVASVVLGVLTVWARRRSAQPVPEDAPVPETPPDPDMEAIRALLRVLGHTDEPPERIRARREV